MVFRVDFGEAYGEPVRRLRHFLAGAESVRGADLSFIVAHATMVSCSCFFGDIGPMLKDKDAKGVGLVIMTGLIVSWVRHGIEHHWHGFASWDSFFLSWFIHTVGVSVFSAFAAAAIMGTHKFFLGDEWKGDVKEMAFYVVMTVLVGAFAVGLVANAPEVDDDDAKLLLSLFT